MGQSESVAGKSTGDGGKGRSGSATEREKTRERATTCQVSAGLAAASVVSKSMDGTVRNYRAGAAVAADDFRHEGREQTRVTRSRQHGLEARRAGASRVVELKSDALRDQGQLSVQVQKSSIRVAGKMATEPYRESYAHRLVESSTDSSLGWQQPQIEVIKRKTADDYPICIENPEEDEDVTKALDKIAPSFTHIHHRLLDLAIGKCTPNRTLAIPIPPTGPLSFHHLRSMSTMAELEFLASIEKELNNPEEKSVADPVPFDLFLMDPSISGRCNDMRQQLALLVPMRKKKGEQVKEMMWYDGIGNLWPREPQTHRRKVASLSGVARILETFMYPPTSLMQCAMNREKIIDSSEVTMDYGSVDASLNDSQQEAVSTVSSPHFSEGLFCVLGPPGTGKTHTINAMINAIGGEMIVAAPSNAAVANVALKVHSSLHYDIRSIVVFGQNCDESARFLNPLHRSEEFRKFMGSYRSIKDDDKDSDGVKDMKRREKDKKRREFARWLKLDEENSKVEDFAQICPYINLEEHSGRRLHNEILQAASIIFCTLNSSGSNMLRNAAQASTYILDEAGQCTESEFYIATTFPGVKRMIVVGDPKQLPPTVIDQDCSNLGYGISWLERTYNQLPKQLHLLNVQYRMDKEILSFPNKQFYDKQIMSGTNVIGREPYVTNPTLFIDTEGRGREEKSQFSWKNEYEAVVIKSLLYTDEDILTLRAFSPNIRTIIITPYRSQVSVLTEHLKRVRGVEVTTVDSVQGSEAEVVILSTVRTKKTGFIDNPQRLNVALTRAKRVLRVVGDLSFFQSLRFGDSTLKPLAKHYQHRKLASPAKVRNIAWSSPDWGQRSIWIPTLTSKFHHSIKELSDHDKNVSFNIVLALSRPDLDLLVPHPPKRERPSWYVSSLKGYTHRLYVVWIPKRRDPDILIEAHFAGTKHDCNTFIQKNVNLPVGTCIALSDLSGVQNDDESIKQNHQVSNLFTSWPLTNPLQNAIISCSIDSLPLGNLVLDPHQQEIAVSPPPLLIESRSGTGKTNVLFQHAVIHTQREQQQSPGCFVTVSQRLCNELRQRYQELSTIQEGDVPEFMFFSRSTLLAGLLSRYHIDVDMDSLCSFREYCKERARTFHVRSLVEERLVENEIGGVILGSYAAGQKKRPLNRSEYLDEIRSNITNKTEQGKATRDNVYDVFENYQDWKIRRNSSDINDVVLMLLKEPLTQLFDSAYVDECQDFSYASLLLICKLGGFENLKWIFAGDTAQMISPGCSFTFDGLKQTLLLLQSGIESKLSKVNHLLVNYRTTKDVLLLGNSILGIAKKNFPRQIPHSHPEVAMKDLGLRIRTCDLEDALTVSVKFGHNQSMIHSGDDSDSHSDAVVELHKWLSDHPFILTSLDSKGLEFDDVVILFHFPRKVWDATSQKEESLRMLRELYVAVTRAKRRVVLLIERKDAAMRNFLNSLGCEIEHIKDPKNLQVEFDCETSSELWHQKGIELFDEGRFDLAASCFASANSWGLSNLSKGKHFKLSGDIAEAASAYRRAARYFVDECNYEQTLDVLQELSRCPPWDPEDNTLFDKARSEVPTHLDRHETVRICLIADRWECVETRDLKNAETSTLFESYKDHPKLKSIITKCSEEDRSEIQKVLPSCVARYHDQAGNHTLAVQLYIQSKELKLAEESTKKAVACAKLTDAHVRGCIEAWSQINQSDRNFSKDSYINLLIRLYKSPMEIARSDGKKIINTFGRKIIMFALEQSNLEMFNLHEFHPNEFRTEVNKSLESTFKCCIDIVKWYIEKDDYDNANDYAKSHYKRVKDSELLGIISLHPKILDGVLMSEIKRRKIAIDATCSVFLQKLRFDDAIDAAEVELALPPKIQDKSSQSTNQLKALVKPNFERLKQNQSFSALSDCPLFNFIDLCRDPNSALSNQAHSVKYAKFGKDRILRAFSYGRGYSQDPWLLLTSFSSKHFRKLRRYELLEAFYKVHNIETATWYANLNRENWTSNEIIDIVDVMGLQFPIGVEFLRRGLPAQALPYALNFGDIKTAIEASSEMLKSPTVAEENVTAIISAWREKKPGALDSPLALMRLLASSNYEPCHKIDSPFLMLASAADHGALHDLAELLINFGPSVTVLF